MWLSSITRMQEHRSSRVQCMGLEAAEVLLREMMNPNVSVNDLEDSIQRNQSSHSQTQETGSNNSEGSRSTIRQKGQTRYCADQGVSGKDLPSDLGGRTSDASRSAVRGRGCLVQCTDSSGNFCRAQQLNRSKIRAPRPSGLLLPVLKWRTGKNPHMWQWQQHAGSAPFLVPCH